MVRTCREARPPLDDLVASTVRMSCFPTVSVFSLSSSLCHCVDCMYHRLGGFTHSCFKSSHYVFRLSKSAWRSRSVPPSTFDTCPFTLELCFAFWHTVSDLTLDLACSHQKWAASGEKRFFIGKKWSQVVKCDCSRKTKRLAVRTYKLCWACSRPRSEQIGYFFPIYSVELSELNKPLEVN